MPDAGLAFPLYGAECIICSRSADYLIPGECIVHLTSRYACRYGLAQDDEYDGSYHSSRATLYGKAQQS